MKNFLLLILLSVILGSSAGCRQTNSGGVKWIRFEWEGDSIGGEYYQKLAMFIPFRIDFRHDKFGVFYRLRMNQLN
jgi:hypothetical protein